MPDTFSEGATEGYVEVIAMAETRRRPAYCSCCEARCGRPADCAAVRQNFYRVAEAIVATALCVVRIHRT